MSIKLMKEKSFNSYKKSQEELKITNSVHSYLSIPFSNIPKNNLPLDIYSGNESIPFEERDLLFKNILRKEFSNAIKEFSEKLDNLPISLI